MKKTLIISTLLLSLAPLAALASCESVKADITQKSSRMECLSPVLNWISSRMIRLSKPVGWWLGTVRMILRKLFIPASLMASNV